ncbi:MAG: thiamine-phosphate kinase, partial [Pseudomonadota bacterium]
HAPLARGWPGAFELRDDCAAISPAPGQDLIVKTDPVRADVHFFSDDQPQDIAWKALAVNVSDLAAKGARPLAYTLAVSFPAAPDPAWLHAFSDGLATAQAAFGCVLIGGDTDHAEGPLSLAVTVFGEVPRGRMIQRATPSARDVIYVSGALGDAAVGLSIRSGQPKSKATTQALTVEEQYLRDRYLRPQPRLGLRAALRAYASAAMDLSDGLGKDLGRMCRASGLGAIVEESKMPLSDAFRAAAPQSADARRTLTSAGDDYEILCTVKPGNSPGFEQLAASAGIPVTPIGTMTAETGVQLIDSGGAALDWSSQGYDHFG